MKVLSSITTIDYTRFLLWHYGFDQLTKLLLKPNFFNTEMTTVWSNETKAFSRSIVTKYPSLLAMSLISMMSAINWPLSPINLFWSYAACCHFLYFEYAVLTFLSKSYQIVINN